MGRIKKGQLCSIKNCSNIAIRSLSKNYCEILLKTGLEFNNSERIYLCRFHYKELKKLKSKEDRLEKWRLIG
ncbi:MAG: hypothetical protein QE159_05175 [Candidatus Verstraetearchaeota archaeon]|nr:hypothetical protein [Candidatus Verstraetearchaeota archaeon]